MDTNNQIISPNASVVFDFAIRIKDQHRTGGAISKSHFLGSPVSQEKIGTNTRDKSANRTKVNDLDNFLILNENLGDQEENDLIASKGPMSESTLKGIPADETLIVPVDSFDQIKNPKL